MAFSASGVSHTRSAPNSSMKPVGDLEGPAERADVLAHAEHGLVVAHLLAQAVGDRFEIGELRHCEPTSAKRDHGARPSPSTGSSVANTPSVAVAGSGIGCASAHSVSRSSSSATDARIASVSIPSARRRAS